MSWDDELQGEERDQWQTFVRNVREGTLKAMEPSAFVAQLVPDDDEFDVKFAVELGMAIMLDKPILAIVVKGRKVSGKLLAVADVVVEADIDTEEGRAKLAEALERMRKLS